MTVDDWLAAGTLPRAERLILLAHATGLSRERLIAGSRDLLPDAAAARATSLAARRAAGEPIAYLVGSRDFYGRAFAVDARVLIPRPETELLVDLALEAIDALPDRRARVLDLGTGSGAIAVTIACERPTCDVAATDASADALAVARDNAARLAATIRGSTGDWFAALSPAEAPFDVICANPPYVAADDDHLDRGDLRFEPRGALTDGADGLDALRTIAAGAPGWLVPGGTVAVEHGFDQGAAVRALFVAAGLENAASRRDIAGIERVTSARRPAGGAAPRRL